MYKIEIIIPVYNEEESINNFLLEANKVISEISKYSFTFVFVNDGSTDNTKAIVLEAMKTYNNIKLINFSKNFGKEQAIMAGIKNCKAEACIICDIDLQDPIAVIKDFISKWEDGYKMVYGLRDDRSSDSFLKRLTAKLFYKFYNIISNTKIPHNAGDFRLLDQQIIKNISKINDKNLFMKGVYHCIGFSSASISYKREKRQFGETKFNYIKLIKLALDGIFNSTSLPLKLSSFVGFILALVSFIGGVIIVFKKLLYDDPIRGYPSIMVTILFLFGVQFIFMGLIGEYIARIFDEIKGSPSYVIEDILESEKE